MPPAIAKTSQMWRPSAFVLPKRNRNFRNLRAELRRLNHKLRRKFPPGAAPIHLVEYRARKSPHAAVRIADIRVKQQVQHAAQNRIPNIFVVPRHRAGLNFSLKAIAHHHIETFAPRLHESWYLGEV